MNYNDLIKNWHSKASEEDYFSKFMFEYLAFIAFIKTTLIEENKNDRHSIQWLKRNETYKEKYLNKIKEKQSLKTCWDRIKKELDVKPLKDTSRNKESLEDIKWWNYSEYELQKKSKDDNNKTRGTINSIEDWSNMVEFWYSIRNNLFHGTKNPELKRDKFLVEYGYKTLKELVNVFLEN